MRSHFVSFACFCLPPDGDCYMETRTLLLGILNHQAMSEPLCNISLSRADCKWSKPRPKPCLYLPLANVPFCQGHHLMFNFASSLDLVSLRTHSPLSMIRVPQRLCLCQKTIDCHHHQYQHHVPEASNKISYLVC